LIIHSWGHYSAFIKNENEWFAISDAEIEKVSIEKVQEKAAIFGFLFLYLRMDMVEEPPNDEVEGIEIGN
jgi:hypothetical protein